MSQVVFTAADGKYALQAQVLALSLSRTQDTHTHFVVLGNNWSTRDQDQLAELQTSKLTIELRSVDHTQLLDVRLTNKFPLATTYNVLAPLHFLGEYTRLIYLDADTLVYSSLSELFKISINEGLAAVLDAHIGWVSSPTMWRPWLEEGLAPGTPYLNTGFLVIDPHRWNERKITESTFQYLKKYSLPCVDQDALNLSTRGEFLQLPPKFNVMPYHLLSGFRSIDLVVSQDDIADALQNPVVMHFHRSFLGKPWEVGCIHPARSHWQEIASEIRPRWRRQIDVTGYLRRKAAEKAKMLRLDSRISWSY